MLLGTCVPPRSPAGDQGGRVHAGRGRHALSGPFTRRQLLLYKLTRAPSPRSSRRSVLSFASCRYSANWPASFVGLFLIMLFIQFFIPPWYSPPDRRRSAYSRGRRIAMLVIIGLVVLGLRGALGRHSLWGRRVDPIQLSGSSPAPGGRYPRSPFTSMIVTLSRGDPTWSRRTAA